MGTYPGPVHPLASDLPAGPATQAGRGSHPLPLALDEARWTAQAAAHEQWMDRWLVPHRERRLAGVAHPVHDFLFSYYSETPGRLRRWHPGVGSALTGAAAAAAGAASRSPTPAWTARAAA